MKCIETSQHQGYHLARIFKADEGNVSAIAGSRDRLTWGCIRFLVSGTCGYLTFLEFSLLVWSRSNIGICQNLGSDST